jgi:predicted MPP superfamily phosphohydrolase
LKKILERDIDSINAQQPDIILFAGDLQNMQPSELYPVQDILMKLKAKDGIYSVLGNHDYSDYINADPAIESANERELVNRQTRFGWTVLRNERQVIRRGKDDLVIAGEESGGLKRDTILYDKKKTMEGVKKNSFVIMMQHDPTVWRKDILPDSIPLTVSGHTHGGQYSFFGVRPTEYTYTEDCGLYQEGNSYLYVTKGIGALIPFRFAVSPEIVVITLHRK